VLFLYVVRSFFLSLCSSLIISLIRYFFHFCLLSAVFSFFSSFFMHLCLHGLFMSVCISLFLCYSIVRYLVIYVFCYFCRSYGLSVFRSSLLYL